MNSSNVENNGPVINLKQVLRLKLGGGKTGVNAKPHAFKGKSKTI